MQSKKQVLAMVSLGAAIIMLGAGCRQETVVPTANQTPEQTTTAAVMQPATIAPKSVAAKKAMVAKSGVAVSGAVTLQYEAAVKIYKSSGYYLQFPNCHSAVPSSILTLKSGVKFMLDNHDSESHQFGYNSNTYKIPAYGFVVATAPVTAGHYFLTCDGGGVAELNVQR